MIITEYTITRDEPSTGKQSCLRVLLRSRWHCDNNGNKHWHYVSNRWL